MFVYEQPFQTLFFYILLSVPRRCFNLIHFTNFKNVNHNRKYRNRLTAQNTNHLLQYNFCNACKRIMELGM